MFEIETPEAIYEIEFIHAQFNITSRCNMKCQHCRGDYSGSVDISFDAFKNLISFSSSHISREGGYLISGGEPLLHPKFKNFVSFLREHINNGEFLSITTNGYFLTEKIVDFLQSLSFPDLRISVSLDSIYPDKHNLFRGCKDAYEKAIRAIKIISEHKEITSIVRTTIMKEQLPEISAIADFVESLGADILSFSSVIPVGRAFGKSQFYFGQKAKKELIEIVNEINRNKKGRISLNVNDPLAYLDLYTNNKSVCEIGSYGGCIAGIAGFSVEPNGEMLPCPVLHNQVIMNINNKSPEEMEKIYTNNQYICKLLDRKLRGRCGECKYKFLCGGCRARAEGIIGDFLGEDPDCWLF